MRAGVVQFRPEFGNIEGNLKTLLSMIESEEADLFVLPELALSGYIFESREEALSFSQVPGGEEFEGVARLAGEKGATIVLGFAERAGERLYNSSIMISPDGTTSVYRKVQLFCEEKSIFDPGDRSPAVVDVAGVRLGMMICFDWIFPEIARTLALKGVDILCHSTNLVLPFCQDAMVTRCIENRVFALTSNRVGTENRAGQELTFTGRSQVVTPKGEILTRADVVGEGVFVVDIDPMVARNKAITDVNDVLGDRRPGLYELG
ncbi:MAG: nitrilase-related carbon-nitrogen hydrolase [Candidatus Eisenbacteria bacterium]|nr:nitrilase-related carbon-nitrogen hydrolase [Candidatus Eisenbacteria bacterium]